MDYPISPSEVQEQDLTQTARRLYRPLRAQGFTREEAMHALYAMAKAVGTRYIPNLKATRSRAAKRKARTMLARGAPDRKVRQETGLSNRTLGRIKEELDRDAAPA